MACCIIGEERRGGEGEKGKERDVQGADNREGDPGCVYNVSACACAHDIPR